jgi:hypothetical protein
MLLMEEMQQADAATNAVSTAMCSLTVVHRQGQPWRLLQLRQATGDLFSWLRP